MHRTDDEWKDAVDAWEKEVNEFIEALKKGSRKASKEFDKQLSRLQEEGRDIARDLKGEDETAKNKIRDALNELDERLDEIQDKLTRAWDELKK